MKNRMVPKQVCLKYSKLNIDSTKDTPVDPSAQIPKLRTYNSSHLEAETSPKPLEISVKPQVNFISSTNLDTVRTDNSFSQHFQKYEFDNNPATTPKSESMFK